jgi:sulfate adenylyltransferase subunit 1 (EFTu-like GTPase family)
VLFASSRITKNVTHNGIRIGTYKSGAKIVEIYEKRNLLGEIEEEVDLLEGGDLAKVRIHLDRPAAVESHDNNPYLGRFVLYDKLAIISAGGRILA